MRKTRPNLRMNNTSARSYYEHDQNESLNAMTTGSGITASFPQQPQSATSLPSASRTPSRGNHESRIPRRVKSELEWTGSANPNKRSVYTSSVSSCLLASSSGGGGGGDGVSLDPDVDMWLDVIPLSRKPLRNFHRDFSDGVLMAEIMCYFFPKKVDMHNYVPANATASKKSNWQTLNHKVLSKMGIRLQDSLIESIVVSKPGAIEKALRQVHRMIENVDRDQVETRVRELTGLAGSFNGANEMLDFPFMEEPCLVRSTPGEVPDCVIFQNIKYYPSTIFEEIAKAEEQLREKNNELCNKVRRLETLLSLKENHLQDLTSKIHELRSKSDSPNVPNLSK
ncbi:Sperm flagellar protein 1 [Orchesella cincta]|uniref:Sperm flagellar protein 1 n=1 Tax=Orchesella cincta TaxID=48709 RepID=A0A1D2MKX7_ORCCI|nr:Sperm flagellar protein 1 [Orchesella cincta]